MIIVVYSNCNLLCFLSKQKKESNCKESIISILSQKQIYELSYHKLIQFYVRSNLQQNEARIASFELLGNKILHCMIKNQNQGIEHIDFLKAFFSSKSEATKLLNSGDLCYSWWLLGFNVNFKSIITTIRTTNHRKLMM